MKLILFISLLSTISAHAFTLNNNFGGAFKKNKVNVYIADTTTCTNIGMDVYALEGLISPAVDKFWNEVPTSALRLKAGGFTAGYADIDTHRLCAPTDDPCISSAAGNVIPPVKDIVIACNDNPANYGGAGSSNVLAVTVPNNFSGRKITGAVILINDQVGSAFGNLSTSDKISVIAHEIGHAIGLGHSEDRSALMYYKTVDLRRSLGQDDVDGVSYLYPIKMDGCGLFGGTIKTDDQNKQGPPFWQMGASLIVVVLLGELLRLLKRSKARAAF